MMGDGMVSMGSMIVKPNAVKIRRIPAKGSDDPQKGTLVGFAGATADAFTLLERLEGKLDEYPGQLSRSCVELAKGWRTDKYLRRLEASLIVADEKISLQLTGNGDVLEMNDGVISVGSGSPYATGTYGLMFACREIGAVLLPTLMISTSSLLSGRTSTYEHRRANGGRSCGSRHEHCRRHVRSYE
jgi:ATP-dependent HslUV protease subunit HslV